MLRITDLFKRLFMSKIDKAPFPRISLGFREEELKYETDTELLYINSTWVNGRRVYLDGIQKWKSNKVISNTDKEVIFKNILDFLNKEINERPIMVINTDHDKDLWEALCEQYKDQINSVEYESDREKSEFLFGLLLDNIRRGGSLMDGDRMISTEEEFLVYWQTKQKK